MLNCTGSTKGLPGRQPLKKEVHINENDIPAEKETKI